VRTDQWWVASCTGRSSGAPPPVWASHRSHADLSSTSPCWATAVCWWCHSAWCWSSGWGQTGGGEGGVYVCVCECVYVCLSTWGLWWTASPWSPSGSPAGPRTSSSCSSAFPDPTAASRESRLRSPASTARNLKHTAGGGGVIHLSHSSLTPSESVTQRWARLTKGDEELPVASALVRRQRENTRHVVPVWRLLLLQDKTRGAKAQTSPSMSPTVGENSTEASLWMKRFMDDSCRDYKSFDHGQSWWTEYYFTFKASIEVFKYSFDILFIYF